MPNNCLSLLYKHIIQVENKNVGLKVGGGGGGTNIQLPPNKKSAPPHPTSYASDSFQSVLHDCCNKGCGVCYPVWWVVHIKDSLLLINKPKK